MEWKDKAKEWGGGDVGFLSEDGEVITFVVCGGPALLKSKFKGQEGERIAAPLMTIEGFKLLILGKRVFRRLAKYEDRFKDTAFMIIRRGESGDPNTKYELLAVEDETLTKKLLKLRKEGFDPGMVDEALKAAEEILSG